MSVAAHCHATSGSSEPAHGKPSYERRQPEKTLLYQTIQKHLNTFFAKCEASDRTVPAFVKKEFEAFLCCGILAHGFARVYCSECRFDRLVAFSCKGRGFCGSCMARRMSETAWHLVESVIPEIPTRQWVLSVPPPLRFLMAYDSDVHNMVHTAFVSTVFSWLRKKAKGTVGDVKASSIHPGAVTFVQRFGSALNLNVHFHCVFSDGVFVENESGFLSFQRTPAPTLEEIRHITEKIARRVHRWLEKRMDPSEHDAEFGQKEPLLAACYAASIRYLKALGHRAGQPLMRLIEGAERRDEEREARTVAGFNLHVSIPIAADDRKGLERQLRYMGRPPLSEQRLSQASDGRLIVALKTPWSDGTTRLVMEPEEFIERLVALVPPPRKNMVRYAGVFGPNSHLRKQVVPEGKEEASDLANAANEPRHPSKKRKGWAQLMARVFELDVLQCPRCKSRMQTISFITDPRVITDILRSLKMPTAPPEAGSADFEAEQHQFSYGYDYAE